MHNTENAESTRSIDALLTSDVPMTVATAEKAGLQAFKNGLPRAPAMNAHFIGAACASGTSLVPLLDGYLHGWTIGVLADCETADFPSVKERARIETTLV